MYLQLLQRFDVTKHTTCCVSGENVWAPRSLSRITCCHWERQHLLTAAQDKTLKVTSVSQRTASHSDTHLWPKMATRQPQFHCRDRAPRRERAGIIESYNCFMMQRRRSSWNSSVLTELPHLDCVKGEGFMLLFHQDQTNSFWQTENHFKSVSPSRWQQGNKQTGEIQQNKTNELKSADPLVCLHQSDLMWNLLRTSIISALILLDFIYKKKRKKRKAF